MDLMRCLALLLLCVILSGCAGSASIGSKQQPVELSGVIRGERVVGGEILLAGDLRIPAGSRLQVKPGSTVRVRTSASTKIDPEFLSSFTELLVSGTLELLGTPEKRIRFLPELPASDAGPAWAGIILDHAAKSRIVNVDIVRAETAILDINASSHIRGNRIIESRYGIITQGGAARILDNEITRGEVGIYCWNGSRAYLKNNRVIANAEEGIAVDRSSSPYIDRNSVSGNDIGLVIPAGQPYDASLIKGNREDVRLLVAGGEQ